MTAATITGSQGLFWRPSVPAAPPLRVAHGLRSQNRLAASLVAAICAFTLLLTATAGVSSLAAPGSETRVAVQTDPAQPFVGVEQPGTPVFVGLNGSFGYDGVLGCCVAPNSALDDLVGAVRPNRIAGPGGVDLPGVPSGAHGVPTNSGRGLTYDLPAGTAGIDARVTQIRVMDPLTTGAHPKPNGYVAYMNETGQTVNPLTGQTVARSDPFAHIELPG